MDTNQLIKGLQALTEISDMTDAECQEFDNKLKFGSMVEVRFFDSCTEPMLKEEPLVYVTANGKMGTFKKTGKNWRWYAEKYNVKYWAYQRDIVSGLIME